MKAAVFVEGISDKLLVEQYCDKLKREGFINADCELEVNNIGGWTKIDSPEGEQYINMMKRNVEGKNLLIFDADQDPESRKNEIEKWKNKYSIDFELFLFPNNKAAGAVETLLEMIINPENQCVINCWHDYEEQLKLQTIPWKNPSTPTSPSEKSKIYGYLEALVGTTKAEKEKIKDKNRNFTIQNYWNLDSEGIAPLKNFLIENLA